MTYKGKFKTGTGEKNHVIYDLKTGLAFGILNEDGKPDSSRALIMREYLNRVDVMAALLAECQQALEHYGLSPATVAEIEHHFDTWGQKAIEEKLPDKPGIYGKYIIKKANGEPTDPAAQYFVLRIDSDPHARQAIRAYAKCVRDDNSTLATDLLKWANAWESHRGNEG